MESRKKRKRRKNYVLLVVSDAPGDSVKHYRFTKARIRFNKILLSILLLVLVGYIMFSAFRNMVFVSREEVMRDTITELEEANAKLDEENQELAEKVNILSETVNQKVDAEKEQLKKNMPTGFPLSGTADMEEITETVQVEDEEVTRDLILFKAGDGVSVVASGAGSVLLADIDSVYGYQVQIDHGNGYISIYRSGTEPKVKNGDEVTRGTLLFEMESDDDDENASRMGYQIMKDGEYIKPTEVLEING
ncbi:MAG: peptidoglycan DD-metalloendopeptidase family protein [Lachnospiraceae bacterium]|nr:peptidoglycan DD-metalloendopeptidase family protein [Lachnospiraceae bacterium]